MNEQDKISKAYENLEFLNSRDGRTLRILSEYLYPEQHLRKNRIYHTIVFFGSARTISSENYKNRMSKLLQEKEKNPSDELDKKIKELKKLEFTTKYYDAATELARKISEWSKTLSTDKKLYVCTGGGPGMMEAANKGAIQADAQSIGFNIELPFEQEPNRFITPELNFEFHYFFMRKFWFVYHSKAIVMMPGGMGTLDEMMELLTLEQTNVISKKVPIVLFGSEYWKKVINFEYLSEIGLISEEDLDLFEYIDDVDEAFEYIKKEVSELLKVDYENM